MQTGEWVDEQVRNQGRDVVIVQAHFEQGGAEYVAAWAVQAVKDLARVTVLTYDQIDPAELNRRFGTNLQHGDFEVVRCRFPFAGKAGNLKLTILKLHWFMRRCKRWPERNVLFFSASSEMDFGSPGVQYIDFPQLVESATRSLGLFPPGRWYHRPSLMRGVYLWLGCLFSRFSLEGVKTNCALTVSNWTGEVVRKVYGVETRTVYPPVTLEFPEVPFAEREPGFVCLGRIVPAKRILELISIMRSVRERGFDVHLHIIGPVGDSDYVRRVRAAQGEHSTWVFLEGSLERARMTEMITRHRFGIHGMLQEHFGIAVAEMAKAGCIVFLPCGGGQPEIVDHDSRVVYVNDDEAVDKIVAVLEDEQIQANLSEKMSACGSRFSSARFVSEIQDAVKPLL
jgi:glycosyltransferase involved in cell wall biosynthesis